MATEKKGIFKALRSLIPSRDTLATYMGQSYNGDRDLYTALGYKLTLHYDDYLARFLRQDICRRIVDAFPKACWRGTPNVKEPETENEETKFEAAWNAFVKKHKVYPYLLRADIVSGIGSYGVLYMGYNDGKRPIEPVTRASDLLFLRPVPEGFAKIKTYDIRPDSPRYGLPDIYEITLTSEEDQRFRQVVNVHYSRILHLAENCLTDDVFGTPRLQAVFNRMEDVARLAGGSAEMFWRGAFQGIAFVADSDAEYPTKDTDPDGLDDLNQEIEDYIHGLKRYLRLQGVKPETLTPNIAKPKEHFDIQMQLISGASGIPQRILLGSEQGELASSQDENNWNNRVDERKQQYVEPLILRPFITKQIEMGLLPMPKGGIDAYTVNWPDALSLSEKDRAEVARTKAEAIKAYTTAPGAEAVLPVHRFLTDFLGYSAQEATDIQEGVYDELLLESQEEEQAAALLAETEQLPEQGEGE